MGFDLLTTGLAKLLAGISPHSALSTSSAVARGFADATGHLAAPTAALPAACTSTAGMLLDQSLLTDLPPEIGPQALSARSYLDTVPNLGALSQLTVRRSAETLAAHTSTLRNLLDVARHTEPGAKGAAEAIAQGRAAGVALLTAERSRTVEQLLAPGLDPEEAVRLADEFRLAVSAIPYLSPAERAYQEFVIDRVDALAAQAVARTEAQRAVRPAAQTVNHPVYDAGNEPLPERPEFDQYRTGGQDVFLNLPADHPVVLANQSLTNELTQVVEEMIGPVAWNGEIRVIDHKHPTYANRKVNAFLDVDGTMAIAEQWADHPARVAFLFHEMMHARSRLISGEPSMLLAYLAAPSFEEGIVEGLLQTNLRGAIERLWASPTATWFQGEDVGSLLNGWVMYENHMHTAANITYEPYLRFEKIREALALLHPEFAGSRNSQGALLFYQMLMNIPAQQRLAFMHALHRQIIDDLGLVPERAIADRAYNELVDMRPGKTRHDTLMTMTQQTYIDRLKQLHQQFHLTGDPKDIKPTNTPAPSKPILKSTKPMDPNSVAVNTRPGRTPPILPPGNEYRIWFPAESASAHERALASLRETGGFTYHPGTEHFPTEGVAVSPYPDRTQLISHFSLVSARHLAEFERNNADLFADPLNHVGGWLNPKTGNVELDVVRLIPNREINVARRLAVEHGQEAVFDLAAAARNDWDKALIQIMSPLQRARFSRMSRAEREAYQAMTHEQRRRFLRERTTKLGAAPRQREVDAAIEHYHEVIDENVGRTFTPLIRGEADEALNAIRERLAPLDIVLQARTPADAQRELRGINAQIRKLQEEAKAAGKPEEDIPKQIDWRWAWRQGQLRAQITSRYTQALDDILGAHGVHLPYAREWIGFYPNASFDIGQQLSIALNQGLKVDFPTLAALVAVTSGGTRWPFPGEDLDSLNHNIGILRALLRDWKQHGELGKPLRDTAGNLVFIPELGGPYQETYGLGQQKLSDIIEATTKILQGAEMFRLEGAVPNRPKQTRFFRNLMGDLGAVTADRHAQFLAFYGTLGKVAKLDAVGEAEYTAIEASILRIAGEMKLDPSALQALLWGYAREVYETSPRGRTKEQNERRRQIWKERLEAGLTERPVLLSEDGGFVYDDEVDLVESAPEANPVTAIYDAMEDMDIQEMLDYVMTNLVRRPS